MFAEEINKTVTISGREYLVTRKATISNSRTVNLYEIVGKRGANGAVSIHQDGQYKGRPVAVGISALERLNWWELVPAFATIDEAVSA